MKISPARVSAFDILLRIETEKAFSSVLLPIYEEKLAANDRALCHELVLGALRRQMYLDKLIEYFAGEKKLDIAVRIALRLGIYQLLYLDKVPTYSAINESVNLVQRAKKTSAKGFVNAILRRVGEGVPAFDFADEIEQISIETSHPRWLIEKWEQSFGIDEARELAVANNTVPRVAFRFSPKGAELETRDLDRSEFVDGCYVAPSLDPELRSMAEAGEIYVQDEASQMVSRYVAELLPDGSSFIDICAAPGGKTTHVAAIGSASLIVAGDLHASRIRTLRSTCARQGLDSVNIVQYDAEVSLPFAEDSFDVVFVDAPCSGTGTIRHNPEIRYFLQSDDFSALASKQRSILENASKVVRPGGRLIYSTCSIEREENEEVCTAFEGADSGFRRISPAVPSRFRTQEGFARTFPHRDNIDGFFIAAFERTAR